MTFDIQNECMDMSYVIMDYNHIHVMYFDDQIEGYMVFLKT